MAHDVWMAAVFVPGIDCYPNNTVLPVDLARVRAVAAAVRGPGRMG